jgi:hypothetical protein
MITLLRNRFSAVSSPAIRRSRGFDIPFDDMVEDLGERDTGATRGRELRLIFGSCVLPFVVTKLKWKYSELIESFFPPFLLSCSLFGSNTFVSEVARKVGVSTELAELWLERGEESLLGSFEMSHSTLDRCF